MVDKQPPNSDKTLPSKPDWSKYDAFVMARLRSQGMTQADLADGLSLHPSTVSRRLSDPTKGPRGEAEVRNTADLLGLTHEELLDLYYEQVGRPEDQDPTDVDLAVQPAIRSFLLQGEVRLSSLYRTATALLGASALMLVLPMFFPSAPAQLLEALFRTWAVSPAATLCLGAALAIAFAVPLWGFILVIGDLLGFYFTANHFGAGDRRTAASNTNAETHLEETSAQPLEHSEVFNPRLTLHGLRMSDDVVPAQKIEANYPDHYGVLLPPDSPAGAAWRENFRARVISIFKLSAAQVKTEGDLIHYMQRLAVSRSWPLTSEVAKLELLLTKHILVIRIGLLRFLKSLLLVPVTAVTVLIATSLISASDKLTLPASAVLAQLIGVLMFWAPAAITAVGAPARWIYRQAPGPGEVRNVYDDARMVRYEGGVVFLACVNGMLIAAAAVLSQYPAPRTDELTGLVIVGGFAVAAWAFAMTLGWKGRLADTGKAFWRMFSVGRGN